MSKTTISITLDQDVAVETYDLRKNRQLSPLVNSLLREYVGLDKEKEKTEDLSDADIDLRLTKLLAETERLKKAKNQRVQAEKDKYKNIKFID